VSRFTGGAGVVGCLWGLCAPILAAWRGWLLMLLWNWFAPAPFAHIGIAQAYGLSLMAALMSGVKAEESGKEYDAPTLLGEIVGCQILTPGLITLAGYIVHHFWGSP
jgi:hypothetical protein